MSLKFSAGVPTLKILASAVAVAPGSRRRADGTFGGQYGESITVYTSADDAAFAQSQDTAGQSDYAHGIITIPAKRAVI